MKASLSRSRVASDEGCEGSLDPDAINTWAQAALPRCAASLRALVDHNSGTENLSGVARLQTELADVFSELGLKVELLPQVDRAPILRARTAAAREESNRIVILGHADTVFGADSAFQNFSIDAQDSDKARGPGAYDMKSGLVVIIESLRALRMLGRLDHTPLEVLINSAEEFPTKSTCAAMQRLMRGASAALVFEFGRDNNAIILERKGMARYRISIEGKEAHAGNGFFEGRSAVIEMARVICELSALSSTETGVTVNAGLVEAHNPLGVVAGKASFGVELRACSSEHLDAARAVVQKLHSASSSQGFKYSVHEIEHSPPMERISGAQQLFEDYQAAGQRAGVDFVENGRVGGTSDGNLASAIGIPTIDALGPRGGGAHTEGEFVFLSSIPERLSTLVHFLLGKTRSH